MATDRAVRIIAYLKLFMGVVLALSGIGLLRLLHEDAADVVMRWINAFHVDPDNRDIQNLLLRASVIDERQLKVLSIGSFFFAGLSLTEGSALLLQKRWAMYLSVAVMASFIPLELWELSQRFSGIKTAVVVLNAGIVWYLAFRIKYQGTTSLQR